MDSGQVTVAHIQGLVAEHTDPCRLTAVGGPLVDGVAPLWRAEVAIGPYEDEWRDRVWAYESCTFMSATLSTEEMSNVMMSEVENQVLMGTDTLQYQLQPQCSFQRKPSFAERDPYPLPWPCLVATMSIVQPDEQFQPPPGFLVGPGAPSFATFGVAYSAFFSDNYRLTGTSNPLLGQLTLRLSDLRGRIISVAIQATQLKVEVEGAEVHQAELELMATSDRGVALVPQEGPVAIPLPHGLPDDAWIWLRSDSDWFDYRSLGGWSAYRTPGVSDERGEPVAELAAMVAQGESLHVEFKSQLPTKTATSRRSALKTVVAFANGDGGTLIYGIADDGSVPGLVDADARTVDGYFNVLRASTSPMPPCHGSLAEIEGKQVLVVHVEANVGTIYALSVETDRPEFYVRRGATSFPARAEELQAIIGRNPPSAQLSGLIDRVL